jgi:hypothetical protein
VSRESGAEFDMVTALGETAQTISASRNSFREFDPEQKSCILAPFQNPYLASNFFHS